MFEAICRINFIFLENTLKCMIFTFDINLKNDSQEDMTSKFSLIAWIKILFIFPKLALTPNIYLENIFCHGLKRNRFKVFWEPLKMYNSSLKGSYFFKEKCTFCKISTGYWMQVSSTDPPYFPYRVLSTIISFFKIGFIFNYHYWFSINGEY